MIQFDNIETYGWEAAIRGMRNPMNSWGKSDSGSCEIMKCEYCEHYMDRTVDDGCKYWDKNSYRIGPNDHSLMMRLAKSGTDHAKFRRMITVTMDILAPLYWWKEFDTYKIGTVANSCSTMHKITEKEFTIEDFSHEQLFVNVSLSGKLDEHSFITSSEKVLNFVVDVLNVYRRQFIDERDSTMKKLYWWQIIQLLPSSYNQLRTVQLNYEVLANIYKSRREHKLDEWREFCTTIESLPYSEIITLQEEN